MCPTSQLEERIEKCEKILSGNSDSLIFAALSDAYRKQGDLARAFHVCTRGLKLHLDYGPGHLVMAKINMERGMYSEAEKELSIAIQTDGNTRATDLLQAQILIKKGETKEAKRILDKLKSADPENQTIKDLHQAIKQQKNSGKSGYDTIAIQESWHIERVVDLKDAVSYLKSLHGVVGALVVGENGLVLESKFNPKFNQDLVGAIASSISQRVIDEVAEIGFGEYEQIMIETENFEFWVTRFNHQALVLYCTPDANLGALRVRVGELLEHLSGNLE